MFEAEFEYHDEVLPYFLHMYNLTHLNERMVEIAIAHWWLETQIPPNMIHRGLEVGNVLGHYSRRRHKVIDLYEQAAWYQRQQVANIDMFYFQHQIAGTFPWVCSISTIEHTGAGFDAIGALKQFTQPGGKLLVTFPTGVDSSLDDMVNRGLMGFTRSCTISRCGDDWLQDEIPTVSEYGPWANAVAVCEWTSSA
jgi:hypothetical protein